MIHCVDVVNHQDVRQFVDRLGEQIGRRQKDGYYVQVQYSTTTIGHCINHSALVVVIKEDG